VHHFFATPQSFRGEGACVSCVVLSSYMFVCVCV
jgi:hypothetical protein